MSPFVTNFKNNRRMQAIVGAGCIFLLLLALWTSAPTSAPPPQRQPQQQHPPSKLLYGKGSKDGMPTYTFSDGSVFQKPKKFKIYGLVFYGRWDRVQILDCYLKKNLVQHGGFLDKVVFISNTAVKSDLAALEKLLKSEPEGYVLGKTIPVHDDALDFHNIWEGLDPDALYIKIDDDIVYIHNDAIPSLIRYRFSNPEYFIVSANVINNPALSWVHERLGATSPFLPEREALADFNPTQALTDWKISSLPFIKHSGNINGDIKPPNKPHRWLPVDTRTRAPFDVNNDHTPMAKAEYNAWGPGWNDWRLAAQQHYSFFQNAELGERGLRNYWFERWDMNYDRLSINFIAIWGKDVADSFPIPRDDEAHLTQTVPKRLGRHVVVHGQALTAHYSFGAQKDGLANTDVLERYRAYAKDYCGKLLV
ncbi:hypothetical protein FN846DRAFT_966906 [Sphaerosporella brunnea]|uniref:Uncharacterized protein n=1 Tax=Sphaerosporella brunnea TaxID=1250544 RepID=A0A5J5EKR9_9PEZI|nr:hypothetical protein FN846DRAFT_966906 [Sphaerosporella brunnea]